jgi:putative membrane protein
MNKLMVSICSLCFSAMAHSAETGNPAAASPDTPGIESAQPKSDHSNTQDKLFVRQAALSGRAEVELGKLAQSRAAAEPVRAFARQMVMDHGKANEKLAKLGKGVNAEIPGGLDPEDAAFRTELEKEKGAAFDQRYLAKQIGDHQKTLNLLQWQIGNGQNAALKAFASEQLPIVSEHLRQAQAVLAGPSGSGGSAAPP